MFLLAQLMIKNKSKVTIIIYFFSLIVGTFDKHSYFGCLPNAFAVTVVS